MEENWADLMSDIGAVEIRLIDIESMYDELDVKLKELIAV